MNLILASSSKYRKIQLAKLGLDFNSYSPNIDETALLDEKPADLALRLARTKAEVVQKKHPGSIIIGSDQVAYANDKIIGKPGSFDNAVLQLKSFSDQTVTFYTAVCITNGSREQSEVISTECKFVALTECQIRNYLQHDQPFDTAGSAKIEQLGIALMQYVRSDDPTALIGLPLIAVCRILKAFGIDPLNQND